MNAHDDTIEKLKYLRSLVVKVDNIESAWGFFTGRLFEGIPEYDELVTTIKVMKSLDETIERTERALAKARSKEFI